MTTPAEPATGAPGAPATGSTSEPPATSGQQPATGGQNDATDWATTFEGMTPDEVKQKLDFARKWEKQSKANKTQLDQLTAAQQAKAGEPTAEDLQAQLTEATTAREQAEERVAELAYETAVTRIAATAGADPEALLDSDSFRAAVSAELGDDFDDEDLRAAVTKVAKDYAKKPRFAATPAASPRGGADMAGGTPPPAKNRPRSLHEALKSRQQ
jgi:hypothetical protein